VVARGITERRVDPIGALLGLLDELDAPAPELLVGGVAVAGREEDRPFAMRLRTCSAVSAFMTGAPGMAISTIATSG
jgi:hypothetical protein